jgi:hypothetical protein
MHSGVDFDTGTIQIRQQLQRIGEVLMVSPVKPRAGERCLPLLDLAPDAILVQAERRAAYETDMGRPGLVRRGYRITMPKGNVPCWSGSPDIPHEPGCPNS